MKYVGLFRGDKNAGIDVDADMIQNAFFGTLESDLEDTVVLDGAFAELSARFDQLRDAYAVDRIDQTTFGRYLMDLRVVDDNGVLWTIGATTGKWYRRTPQDGRKWNAAPTPTEGGGQVVDRFGNETGWATQTYTPAQEAQPDPLAAFGDHGSNFTHSSDPNPVEPVKPEPEPHQQRRGDRVVISVDEMFGTYVEEVTDPVQVHTTILPVDEVTGDDSWKDRYGGVAEDDSVTEVPEEAPDQEKGRSRKERKEDVPDPNNGELLAMIRDDDGTEH